MIGTAFLVIGLLLAGYATVGYPALLWLEARVFGRRWSWKADPHHGLPSVSVTVPAHNEVHQIEELLQCLTALEYPRDRLQILIVSDGSTDGTDEIVEGWAGRGVELLRVDERGGKGAAENAARDHLTGAVVVNTDASIRIRPDALKLLVAPFADPEVGVVSGRDVSVPVGGSVANVGEGGYVGFEMWVRDLETKTGGIVGASGSLYATRRELHQVFVPPNLSRDFASVLIARERGFRAVSAPNAICVVPRTGSLPAEYRRKVRTIARGMTTLATWRHLLHPLKYPAFAWRLLSHKVLRWGTPLYLILVALGVAILALDHGWARWALGGLFLLVGMASVGWAVSLGRAGLPRILAVPAFFAMSNVAIVRAALRAGFGGSERLWEPTRRVEAIR